MADKGQQTEEATPQRLQKARREGQFSVSREFVSAVQFLAFVAAMAAWGPGWVSALRSTLGTVLGAACMPSADPAAILLTGRQALTHAFAALAPAGLALMLATLAAQFATTGLGFSLKKLAPDFNRLNPISRLRGMPGQNLSAFVQSAILLPVFGMAVWVLVRDNLDRFLSLPLETVETGAKETGVRIQQLFWKAAGAFLVFGCVDLFRQKQKYRKDLRMSKQEVREESKESEGNPQTKGRIRRIQRDLARRRMMQEVPTATAVIVNPTHYAVAIRYSMASQAAPVVVAKGRNYLALRIRERAIEHQVPIVENPPLAQALYKSVEVGQEIPAHLYRAVAEILAYIYKLMRGRLPGQ